MRACLWQSKTPSCSAKCRLPDIWTRIRVASSTPTSRTGWRLRAIIRHCGHRAASTIQFRVCGVSARFMVAYTLNRAASERAVRLSSSSCSCFAWRATTSASFSIWSAVKNTTFFLSLLPDVISMDPRRSQAIERFGRRRVRCNLDLMDMAAAIAADSPLLLPGTRRRDSLHRGSTRALPASRT